MIFNTIKSYAKININLNIIGKNKSLHKIESVIAFVNLHDKILIKKIKSKKHIISFVGKFSKNIGKNNTVYKLLRLLEKKKLLSKDKFEIKVIKNIPNRAGLGGGSMNVASLLKYFTEKKIIKVKKKEIINISYLIGSDVPLGLNYTNSILTSKNKIKRFYNYKKIYALIVKPNFGCSTKRIYSEVKKFHAPALNNPQKKIFNLQYLKKMHNSLEPIVFKKYPKLKKTKIYIENFLNPIFVRMTGSGSALVAYFQSNAKCESAKKRFIKKYKNYWCIASKTI